MTPEERDRQIRLAAFKWLDEQRTLYGDGALPWQLLQKGFVLEGTRIPLVSMNGIFKPAAMPYMPLTIRTAVDGPYEDHLRDDGVIRYAFRGTNPEEPDNQRLRATIKARAPLIHLFGVVEGRYLPSYPVYVVGEDSRALTFLVEAESKDDIRRYAENRLPDHDSGREALQRRYMTVATTRRLHQQVFRERVLEAYKTHCALCRLRHEPLLDAAHIIPDNEDGPAEVRNGLALCKIHHAAYDRHFLAIRPDYSVEVRKSLLDEIDGPMLQHGLIEMHECSILLPSRRSDAPDRDFLERRYQRFLAFTTSASN
jgi:putative restriction endonuclease